jgi:putative phosphotransacetylase
MDASLKRAEIENLVRQAVYRRLGTGMAASAEGSLRVNVSARHCHLTQQAVDALFGAGHRLRAMRELHQKGQFAAEETVTLIGPRSRVISNLRILGPCRELDQVELSYSDAVALGFEIPARMSGSVAGSPGCMLMGPAGFFEMKEGVIRAMRHVHMSPGDAARYGVKHLDEMTLKVGGDCGLALEKVVVRVHADFRLEVHIDTDEGNACNLRPGTPCELAR